MYYIYIYLNGLRNQLRGGVHLVHAKNPADGGCGESASFGICQPSVCLPYLAWQRKCHIFIYPLAKCRISHQTYIIINKM